jgi:transposase-like protein
MALHKRVSPIDAVRAEIDALFGSDKDLSTVLEDVGRLTVRLIIQMALEAEVNAFLQRERYERKSEDAPAGYRNGHQPPATIRTTMGPIGIQRPKLRGSDERFCSQLFGTGVTRTNALEALVISAWVRGLSDRDIEAALAEVLGPEAALSRSTVSRICSELKEEFKRFAEKDLSGLRLDYLFLDGANFKMHEHARPEPVLCAWGIDTDGHPHLVAMAAASSESADAWGEFCDGMIGRGLKPPLLVISDGAPGLIAAIEVHFSRSLRQRCVIHRLRNAVAKVAAADQESFKRDWWALFNGIEEPPGDKAVAECLKRVDGFRANWEKAYPAAVACLVGDFQSLAVHLRFPAEHWHRIRHTNLIERTFGESRRRTKVIGRLPGEKSCLALVWAVLDRQSRGWRGVTMTPRALRRLQDLRRQLFTTQEASEPELAVTAAA